MSAPKKKAASKKSTAAKGNTVRVTVKSSADGSKDGSSIVDELKAEEHKREEVVLGGWPAGVTTYRIGPMWICKVDNVSPGATVARGRGATREEAVEIATSAATRRLAATRVHR